MTPTTNEPVARPLTSHETHVWSLQLYIMLSSGVPLLSALGSVAGSDLPRLAPVSEGLTRKLDQGFRLSEAMRALQPAFSDFLINLVVVGENTGKLVTVLERAALRAARRDKLEREIKSALAYPFFLTVVSVAMALFMGFYMFPKLLPFLMGLGAELPWPTRVLVWLTGNLSSSLLILTIVIVWAGHLLASGAEPRVQRLRRWLLYNTPIIGPLNRDRLHADVSSDLSILLEAGCDLMHSLKTLKVRSPEYQERIRRCARALAGGMGFSEAVESSEMLPKRFVMQVRSGEETGKLADVFKRISTELDRSIALRIAQLVQLLEPLILAVMGLVTGFIVLATFLPLYGMATSAL